MRKYLILVLGLLFIFSYSATAFAIHETQPGEEEGAVTAVGPTQITLGGKLLVRGWYFENVGIFPGDALPRKQSVGPASFYTTNINITMDAKIGNNVRGMIEIESGLNRNSGLYIWAYNNNAAHTGNSGEDTKPDTQLFFRQAWIQYTGSGLLGVPAGIKVGHMPISIGEKQFINNERFGDDGIIVWVDPTKELHLAVATAKLAEGDFNNPHDDVDGYIVLGTYNLDKDNVVGLNNTFIHSDHDCPSFSPPFINVSSLNFDNIEAHAHGNVSGLTYAAEVDYQLGRVNKIQGLGGEDRKLQGYAIFAKAGYQLDPVNLRGSFALGSGDNNSNDDECREFQSLQGPDYSPTARLIHYTQIYERTVRTAAHDAHLTTLQSDAGNATNTGIANTTYFNLGFDVTPLKELSLSLDGFILKATNVGAWETQLGRSVSHNLGWELDSKLNYKIAKNLNYFIEAALFQPGQFYGDIEESSDLRRQVKQVVHGLQFQF